jgi:hypothetical protein
VRFACGARWICVVVGLCGCWFRAWACILIFLLFFLSPYSQDFHGSDAATQPKVVWDEDYDAAFAKGQKEDAVVESHDLAAQIASKSIKSD